MAFIEKGRSLAVVKEVSYAAATPTFVDADYVDYTTGDMSTDIEKIERNVIRNSMLKLESILGTETSSGNITVEVSAANTGVVNGTLLYEAGIGKKIAQAVATTATAGTTSSVTVTSAAGLAEGQTIKVNISVGVDEYVMITDIAGLVLTVSPNFSVAPDAGDAVQGLLSYILPKPNDAAVSLAVRENMKPQSGSAIDYEYLGQVVTDTSMDYPVGGIATAAFTLAGAGFTVDATGTTPTLPCAIATPIVGKNATFSIGGTSYTAQDVSVKVGTEVTDIKALTTDGLTNKIAIGKTITGSFKVEYTGTTLFDLYKAGTKGALRLLLKDGGATSPIIHGILAPSVKLTNVSKSVDGGVYYNDIEFEALSIDCDTTEKALSVFFA